MRAQNEPLGAGRPVGRPRRALRPTSRALYRLERGEARRRRGAAHLAQSRGSQLAALALGSQDGERILDACAAPGAKATMLRGEVTAVELHPGRARELEENVRRLGVTNVHVVNTDIRELAEQRVRPRARRRALLGPRRPRPPARPRWRAEALPELQLELIHAAAERTKPGGTLVYSVCTLNADENEAVVDASGLEPEPLGEEWPQFAHPKRPEFLLTTPHRHGTSGFFIARLRVEVELRCPRARRRRPRRRRGAARPSGRRAGSDQGTKASLAPCTSGTTSMASGSRAALHHRSKRQPSSLEASQPVAARLGEDLECLDRVAGGTRSRRARSCTAPTSAARPRSSPSRRPRGPRAPPRSARQPGAWIPSAISVNRRSSSRRPGSSSPPRPGCALRPRSRQPRRLDVGLVEETGSRPPSPPSRRTMRSQPVPSSLGPEISSTTASAPAEPTMLTISLSGSAASSCAAYAG